MKAMNKRLLTKDYQNIVFETLTMPKKDYTNYYLNIVEQNHQYNPEIIKNIKDVINNWIEWYKSKVYGGTVAVLMNDGTTEYLDRNQDFTIDKNGKRVLIDIESILIQLPNIDRKVNRAFFNFQLEILNLIKGNIDIENKIESLEVLINTKDKPVKKTFIDYLNHDNKEQFAQKLKEEFLDLAGQNEAALCYCLVNNKLLDAKELDRSKIHKLFKEYFKGAGIIEQAKNITSYLDEYYQYEKNKKTIKLDSKIKGFNRKIGLIMNNIDNKK